MNARPNPPPADVHPLPGERADRVPAFTIVEDVKPSVDGGRYPIKRVVGEEVKVVAACFAHGHEHVACAVRYRIKGERAWREVAMEPLGNDLWSAAFTVDRVGTWEYLVACWIDHLTAWRDGFARRTDPEDLRLNARIGAELIARSAALCNAGDCARLEPWAHILGEEGDIERLRAVALDESLFAVALANAPRDGLTETEPFGVTVDRERARFSAWYELFPRSFTNRPGAHGTFRDLEQGLPYVASHAGADLLRRSSRGGTRNASLPLHARASRRLGTRRSHLARRARRPR